MAKISEHTIEQVRSSADIVDVVSDYVDLKKRGRNFFGLCPFHSEKTASFSVNQDKQIYHCFGCSAGGGSIHFVMQMEKLEFLDAVKHLAEKYNLKIQYDGHSGRKQISGQLEEIHEIAKEHFHQNLLSPTGKKVLAHLVDRGLSQDTIKKFKLGYSQSDWQGLLNIVRKHDFSSEAILQSGLFIDSEKGYFDRFRGRIMFPIHNAMGKTVAFAGRVFESDDPAKYVNSPETPIYHKSKILYGLWAVRNQLRETNAIIIVEGYFDYLQLYQAGLRNVLAVSGTALTEDHARELRKYTRKIVMAYDGDSAGFSAAIRAGYVLLRSEIEPLVAVIPVGNDPDDWVKTKGLTPFNSAVENAKGLISFQTSNFSGNLKNPADKIKFAKDVLKELNTILEETTRNVYVRDLAEIIGLDEKALHFTLMSMTKSQLQRGINQSKQNPSEETFLGKVGEHQWSEDEVIQCCFCNNQEVRYRIVKIISPDWFTSIRHRRIFEQLAKHITLKVLPDHTLVMDELVDSGDRKKLSALIFEADKIDQSINFTKDCIYNIEKRFLTKQMDDLRTQMKNSESDGVDVTSHIVKIEEIKTLIRSLQKKYTELFADEKR